MISKITFGSDIVGLMAYLASEGKWNVHEDPHLVAGDSAIMAWWGDSAFGPAVARDIGRELDHPRQAYGIDPTKSVWHCSLSLAAEEGQLADEKWAEIADGFMERMGFVGGGKAPVRWVAVNHGLSEHGNAHIHLAVGLIREDGTKASYWNDRWKAQAACGELERIHGLRVLEGRAHGTGARGENRADVRRVKDGAPEGYRARLERTVRGVAAISSTEAEFVTGLRSSGVLARPRFAAGSQDVVTGFSVALRPPKGETAVWFGGGRLARDLTLPRLRGGVAG